jgi:hypothetical protein
MGSISCLVVKSSWLTVGLRSLIVTVITELKVGWYHMDVVMFELSTIITDCLIIITDT